MMEFRQRRVIVVGCRHGLGLVQQHEPLLLIPRHSHARSDAHPGIGTLRIVNCLLESLLLRR